MGQIAYWKTTKLPEAEAQPEHWVDNEMQVRLPAIAENEQLARMLVSAFITPLNPTLLELADVKTAVSEAVTNAVIHGYPEPEQKGYIDILCSCHGRRVRIEIRDQGIGIEDIEQAMVPMYTTKPEMERSGMGFAFMQELMDELQVESKPGEGVTIVMTKEIGKEEAYE